jgi:light-regulated signal transduction histidine kinase (bacteriophytochrome)
MSNYSDVLSQPGPDVAAQNVELKETAARQEQAILELRALNRAASSENAGLREAAQADRIEIDELKGAQLAIDQLNRDLEIRNRGLEDLNKELESFSYAVSHDLRSPLRSIHGFTEALQHSASGKLSAEETGWLQKIFNAASRMDRLTEDLLRLSRITRAQLNREPVNLSLIAREIVRELRQAEPGRDVVFAIADSLDARADPVLVRVALANLLGNAWKYTGRRQQALISFGRERGAEQPVYCVRDNGAGFDMAYASKLFAPFQRLHSAREFPGSGVGLACVARVIHKHGGRVWADAKPEQGAAFFFSLPEIAEPPDSTRDS